MHVAVAILRVQEGFDYSGVIADNDMEYSSQETTGIDNPHYANSPEDHIYSAPSAIFSIFVHLKIR